MKGEEAATTGDPAGRENRSRREAVPAAGLVLEPHGVGKRIEAHPVGAGNVADAQAVLRHLAVTVGVAQETAEDECRARRLILLETVMLFLEEGEVTGVGGELLRRVLDQTIEEVDPEREIGGVDTASPRLLDDAAGEKQPVAASLGLGGIAGLEDLGDLPGVEARTLQSWSSSWQAAKGWADDRQRAEALAAQEPSVRKLGGG